MSLKRKHLFLTFEYGDTVDGAWVAGDLVPEEKLLRNTAQLLDGEGGEVRAANPVYDVLIASSQSTTADEAVPGDGGHNCYVGTARSIYQWFIDEGIYAGEIQ